MIFDSDSTSISTSSTDTDVSKKELEEFLLMAKQKLKFDAQARTFNDVCWDICIDKPGSKLDHKTETCLSNCVNRFLDTTIFVGNRFTQNLNKNGLRL